MRIPRELQPKPPLESAVHIQVAHTLHRLLPGANPRVTRCEKRGKRMVPVEWEPAHPWARWWHTPNEGERTTSAGGQAKAMGMRAGIYDLGFMFKLCPDRLLSGRLDEFGDPAPIEFYRDGGRVFIAQAAWIELKRDGVKASKRTPAQVRWGDDCSAVGAWNAECRTSHEVRETLHGWLEPWGLELPRIVLCRDG